MTATNLAGSDEPAVGRWVPGYDVPVVNERAVRAAAGILLLGGGIAWGLAWVAVGRLVGEPRSVVVGIVAILVVAAVLAATWRAGQLPSRRRRPATSTEPSAE